MYSSEKHISCTFDEFTPRRHTKDAYMWCWVAKQLGVFPRDIVKLVAKYLCVVECYVAKIKEWNMYDWVEEIRLFPSKLNIGDRVKLEFRPLCIVHTTLPSRRERLVHVASSKYFLIGQMVFDATETPLGVLVRKTDRILELDREVTIREKQSLYVKWRFLDMGFVDSNPISVRKIWEKLFVTEFNIIYESKTCENKFLHLKLCGGFED